MILRQEYAVYLNPTDSELIKLAESQWDTLRVMESDNCLVIGSGYGNTHETLVQLYKQYSGKGKTKQRWNSHTQSYETVFVGPTPDFSPFIFFHEQGIMLCNLGNVSGPDRARYSRWRKEFSDERVRQFRLIAEFSGLVTV